VRPLVVAAFPPELEEFQRLAPGVATAAVGVGLVDAALGSARTMAEVRPDVVILIGTCGWFDYRGAREPSVVVGAELILSDGGAAEGRAALVGGASDVQTAPAALVDAISARGAVRAAIATTLSITVDDALAEALAADLASRCGAASCGVEHLEAYAVARAAERAGAACVAVLGVANRVGAGGRAAWAAGHAAASGRAADVVARALGDGAIADAVRTTTTAPSPGRA
jgi:nucleoside phosphorylase